MKKMGGMNKDAVEMMYAMAMKMLDIVEQATT